MVLDLSAKIQTEEIIEINKLEKSNSFMASLFLRVAQPPMSHTVHFTVNPSDYYVHL